MDTVIKLRDTSFRYTNHDVLRIAQFDVQKGEKLFLLGPSGSGKSTLLGILSGLLVAKAEVLEVLGTNVAKLSPRERDRFRADHLGFIFQMFNLIPYLSVLENINLPCNLSDRRKRQAGSHAALDLAKRLGLEPYLDRPVTQLSVGQQQRVAAARALVGNPELIIADEPTSSLDWNRREKFLEVLFAEVARSRSTLLFVSHDESLQDKFDRVVSLVEINSAAMIGDLL